MATTQQVAAPSPKKGCSGAIVFMIASLALVIGIIAGAGVIILAMQSDPSIAENLGVTSPAPAAPKGEAVADSPTAEAPAADKTSYALLIPVVESLRIEGDLDEEKVGLAIKENRYDMRECYQKGVEKDPELKGEMGVQFTVSQSGKVLAAVERHTDIGSDSVKKCILDEVKTWEFKGKYKQMSVVKIDLMMVPVTSQAAANAPDVP